MERKWLVVSSSFTLLVPIQDFWNKHIFPLLIMALCVLKVNSPADNGLIVVSGRRALMLFSNVSKYFTKLPEFICMVNGNITFLICTVFSCLWFSSTCYEAYYETIIGSYLFLKIISILFLILRAAVYSRPVLLFNSLFWKVQVPGIMWS